VGERVAQAGQGRAGQARLAGLAGQAWRSPGSVEGTAQPHQPSCALPARSTAASGLARTPHPPALLCFLPFSLQGGLSDHLSGVASTDGKWHHIAVTWRSYDGVTKLYDNGREVGGASGRWG